MFARTLAIALISGFGLFAVTGSAHAADDSAAFAETPVEAPTPVTVEQIAGWVEDLGRDSFRTRRLAMRGLLNAGSSAVGPVSAAADTDNLELASRCIDILKALHQSENAQAKTAAEEALNRLAKSERASVAQRAGDAVKKPEPAPRNIVRGGIRIQFRGAGGGIRIAQPRAALQREFNGEEDGRKIEIKETLGREIVVKVTEKVDGKDKTTEYKATNAAQLKQKHPEAHKLYEKHMRGAGAPRFQRGAVPQAARIVAQNIAIRQHNNNGDRVTEVETDGKKIRISDSQGKDIVVKVAEQVGGKEKITEYKAKDLDELKKKHPEGAKLYEQYATGQNKAFGGIFQGQIQINGGAAPILPMPVRLIPFRRADPIKQAAAKQIEAAEAQLNQAKEQLKELAKQGNAKPEDLARAAKEIEAAMQQLQEAKKQLGR